MTDNHPQGISVDNMRDKLYSVTAPIQAALIGTPIGLGISHFTHPESTTKRVIVLTLGFLLTEPLFRHLEKKKYPLGMDYEDAAYKTTTYLLGSAIGLGAAGMMMGGPLPNTAVAALASLSGAGAVAAGFQKIRHKLKF